MMGFSTLPGLLGIHHLLDQLSHLQPHQPLLIVGVVVVVAGELAGEVDAEVVLVGAPHVLLQMKITVLIVLSVVRLATKRRSAQTRTGCAANFQYNQGTNKRS